MSDENNEYWDAHPATSKADNLVISKADDAVTSRADDLSSFLASGSELMRWMICGSKPDSCVFLLAVELAEAMIH